MKFLCFVCFIFFSQFLYSQILPFIDGLIDSIYSNSGGPLTCGGQNGLSVVLEEDGVCNYNNYYLVFNEEFKGNNLDFFKWKEKDWLEGALSNTANQEYNSINNLIVSNGTCKILTKYEPGYRKAEDSYDNNYILDDGLPNLRYYNYTSSSIWSTKKFECGIFEIKCKLPGGKGMWPAFWLYDENDIDIYNEIDVFEFWMDGNTNSKKKHYMNMHHFDHTNVSNDVLDCSTNYNGSNSTTDFHVFTVKWTPYIVERYVDGELKRISSRFYSQLGQNVDCNSIHAYHGYVMDRAFIDPAPLSLIFNNAIQSGSSGPNSNTSFPQVFEIEYIRYWKQFDCYNDLIIDNDTLIDPELFNFYVANNITVSNNVTLPSNQQLNLSASESIILEPGFTTQNNSFFEAKIEPNFCSSGFSGYINSGNDGDNTVNNINQNSLNLEDNINVYPNPTSNNIIITGNDIVKVVIQDVNGKILKTQNSKNVNQIEINLNEFSNGIYYIIIYDSKNNRLFEKVIKN